MCSHCCPSLCRWWLKAVSLEGETVLASCSVVQLCFFLNTELWPKQHKWVTLCVSFQKHGFEADLWQKHRSTAQREAAACDSDLQWQCEPLAAALTAEPGISHLYLCLLYPKGCFPLAAGTTASYYHTATDSFCPPLLQNRWVQMQHQLQTSVLIMCEQHQAKEDWVQTWAGQKTPNEQLTSPRTSPQSAANTPFYDRTRRQLNPRWDRLTTF